MRYGLTLGAAALAWPAHVAGQAAGCSLTVDVNAASEVAYRSRGERCEGVYIRRVAGSAQLQLRGFHVVPPRYEIARDDALTVTVAGMADPPPNGTLLARSVRARQYYQMDTRELVDGTFLWETDVLRHRDVRLAPSDLAVLYAAPAEGGMLRIWPVRVAGTATGEPSADAMPYLILESEVELTRIAVRTGLIEA